MFEVGESSSNMTMMIMEKLISYSDEKLKKKVEEFSQTGSPKRFLFWFENNMRKLRKSGHTNDIAYYRRIIERSEVDIDEDDFHLDSTLNQEHLKMQQQEEMTTNKKKKKNKNKKRKRTTVATEEAGEAAEMPVEMEQVIMRELQGRELLWLGDKILTRTDVDPHQSRIFLPSCCEDGFDSYLTENEKQEVESKREEEVDIKDEVEIVLMSDKEKKKKKASTAGGKGDKNIAKGKRVMVVDGEGKKWYFDLRKWTLGSSKKHLLTNGWKEMVAASKMKESDKIQLWCFRGTLPNNNEHQRLCFALNLQTNLPN